MQWDEGTAVLFQTRQKFDEITKDMARLAGASRPPGTYPATRVSQRVSECILSTAARGEAPDACLVDDYLGIERNRKKEDYFLYEKIVASSPAAAGVVGSASVYVDACEVHTGPAENIGRIGPGRNLTNEFQMCIDNDLTTPCQVPSFVWSGRCAC
jgi:hypothetical protein